MTLAEQMHEYEKISNVISELIEDLFQKHEDKFYEFHLESDYYDNSLEVMFDDVIEYPYEPSKELIDDLRRETGFSIIYWNFVDMNGDYMEEKRGYEPRRYKDGNHVCIDGVGYVDGRYNK